MAENSLSRAVRLEYFKVLGRPAKLQHRRLCPPQLQLVKNRALAEVETAYEAFQTAREQVQTFRSELLGQADESRTIALAAYEEGGSDLLPVLEAQRTRSEVRQQYFKTLFDYRSSLIDLELAVGREIQP